MEFELILDPRAIHDVQAAIDYYDDKLEGLGKEFDIALDECMLLLKGYPYFQIRYDNVHCLPLKKFPYMIHFMIDDKHKIVTVQAVLFTGSDPEKWKR